MMTMTTTTTLSPPHIDTWHHHNNYDDSNNHPPTNHQHQYDLDAADRNLQAIFASVSASTAFLETKQAEQQQ